MTTSGATSSRSARSAYFALTRAGRYGDGKTPSQSLWPHASTFLSVESMKVYDGYSSQRFVANNRDDVVAAGGNGATASSVELFEMIHRALDENP